MKKIIVSVVFSLLLFNYTNAQCEGKTCKINGGEATVMINSLTLNQSKNTVNLRVSNDGPTANFKLRVILNIYYKKDFLTTNREITVDFNEMAQPYSSSKFEESFSTYYRFKGYDEWDEIRVSIKKCEFVEGTICK